MKSIVKQAVKQIVLKAKSPNRNLSPFARADAGQIGNKLKPLKLPKLPNPKVKNV